MGARKLKFNGVAVIAILINQHEQIKAQKVRYVTRGGGPDFIFFYKESMLPWYEIWIMLFIRAYIMLLWGPKSKPLSLYKN